MTLYKVHEAAQILEVSDDTIRRWEKKGLIKSRRSRHNHRLFSIEELERIKNKTSSGGRAFKVLKDATTPHTVIELFSGAGGMALGLENAGLQTQLLVENNKDAVATLRQNRSEIEIIADDIANVDFSKFYDQIDIVAGGFPCQAFSYAGHAKGFEDTRGTLFFEFARSVSEVRPKIALAENVRGLLKHDKGKTLQTMIKVLEDLGYRVKHKLLKSQFFDVPQKRERLFIVGVREDLNMKHLFPTERDYLVTLRDALKGCPASSGSSYPESKYKVLEQVPPGGYWKDLPLDVQKEYMGGSFYLGGGKTGMARRLSWDEPSLTLTCSPAQKQTERCHPEETRPLTIREYARIQTFPDEWQFVGSLASQYRQIGNAVPVNLAYHVGRCLVTMLQGRSLKYEE